MRYKQFLLVLAACAFTTEAHAENLEIYTYGSGEFVSRIFQALSGLAYSDGVIFGLIKIVLIVGVISAIINIAFGFIGKQSDMMKTGAGAEGLIIMIRQGIMAGVAVYVLMIPKTDLLIIDRTDPSQNRVVQNVPYFSSLISHFSSKVGDRLGELTETYLMDVDAVKFRDNGLGVGAKYISELIDIAPPGADSAPGGGAVPISMVLQEYYQKCIFPEFAVVTGGSSEADGISLLQTSPNILTALSFPPFVDANVQLSASFNANPLYCAGAASAIQSAWNSQNTKWIANYVKKFDSLSAIYLDTTTSDAQYKAKAVDLYCHYFKYNGCDATNGLIQIATINGIRAAFDAWDISTGYTSGNNSKKFANKQTGAGWIEMARLLGDILPLMRAVLESMIYFATAFLPIFFVVGGFTAIGSFVRISVWLHLWIPLYVILNALSDSMFAAYIAKAGFNTDGITMMNIDKIRDEGYRILGYIGAASWSVPMLAWAIIKGGEHAVSSAVSHMQSGGGGASTAQSVGAAVGGMGNITAGGMSRNALSSGVQLENTSVANLQSAIRRGMGWSVGGAAMAGALDDVTRQKHAEAAGKLFGGLENAATERGGQAAVEEAAKVNASKEMTSLVGGDPSNLNDRAKMQTDQHVSPGAVGIDANGDRFKHRVGDGNPTDVTTTLGSTASIASGQVGDANVAGLSNATASLTNESSISSQATDAQKITQNLKELFTDTRSWAQKNGVSVDKAEEYKRTVADRFGEEYAKTLTNKTTSERKTAAKAASEAFIRGSATVGFNGGLVGSIASALGGVKGGAEVTASAEGHVGVEATASTAKGRESANSHRDTTATEKTIGQALSQAIRETSTTEAGRSVTKGTAIESGKSKEISFTETSTERQSSGSQLSANMQAALVQRRADEVARTEGRGKATAKDVATALHSLESDVQSGNYTKIAKEIEALNNNPIKDAVNMKLHDNKEKTAGDIPKPPSSIPTTVAPPAGYSQPKFNSEASKQIYDAQQSLKNPHTSTASNALEGVKDEATQIAKKVLSVGAPVVYRK